MTIWTWCRLYYRKESACIARKIAKSKSSRFDYSDDANFKYHSATTAPKSAEIRGHVCGFDGLYDQHERKRPGHHFVNISRSPWWLSSAALTCCEEYIHLLRTLTCYGAHRRLLPILLSHPVSKLFFAVSYDSAIQFVSLKSCYNRQDQSVIMMISVAMLIPSKGMLCSWQFHLRHDFVSKHKEMAWRNQS
jgi:hypothetical protein